MSTPTLFWKFKFMVKLVVRPHKTELPNDKSKLKNVHVHPGHTEFDFGIKIIFRFK